MQACLLTLPEFSPSPAVALAVSASSTSDRALPTAAEAVAVALQFVANPGGVLPTPADQRTPRLALKNVRLRAMLELEPLDTLPRRLETAKSTVAALQRARTEAFVRRASSGSASSRSSSSAGPLLDNIELLEARLADAEKEVQRLEKLVKARSRATAALVLKQNRDFLRGQKLAGREWSKAHGGSGGPEEGKEGGEADDEDKADLQEEAGVQQQAAGKKGGKRGGGRGGAAASSSSSSSSSASSSSSSSAAAAAAAPAAVQLCAYCAFPMQRGVQCSECGREYCGTGGKSTENTSAAAGPCIQIYRCGCASGALNICHDCFAGEGHARTLVCGWTPCVICERQAMCPRELKLSACAKCSNGPMCRACRPAHECLQ